MAYAAMVSLIQKLKQILGPDQFATHYHAKKDIESFFNDICFLYYDVRRRDENGSQARKRLQEKLGSSLKGQEEMIASYLYTYGMKYSESDDGAVYKSIFSRDLQNVVPYPFGVDFPNPETIRSLFEMVSNLIFYYEEEFPVKNRSQSRKFLERDLRDAIWRAEDLIELYISSHVLSLELSRVSISDVFSQDLEKSILEIESIGDRMEAFTEDVKNGRVFPDQEIIIRDLPPPAVVSTRDRLRIVGFDGELECLKDRLTEDWRKFKLVPIVGMAGIGKTTLAKMVYDDPYIVKWFTIRAWVTISQEYSFREILLELLSKITTLSDEMREASENKLADCVFYKLCDKRFLVVFDGVCDTKILDSYKKIFPRDFTGGRVILTTRLLNMGDDGDDRYSIHRVNFLNEYDSWALFCEVVFGNEPCPSLLEKSGKKIAKNCQRLPLAIISVASHLAKDEKTPEYWNYIAESGNSVLAETEEVAEMTKQLSSSYENLPLQLKPCFLYIAAFPQNYDISASKLVKLWVAEGFLQAKPFATLEEVADECLNELVNRSLILVAKQSSSGGPKTCVLHYAMSLVCSTEARKDDFFCVMNKYIPQGSTNIQRRLSFWKNVLLGIKDVYDKLDSPSTVRSLLCPGAYHPFPLGINLNIFKLLRVLDALTIRFYELPCGIFELIHLRYLALNYNGEEFLAGLLKLRNLEFLIVFQHLSIRKSSGDPSLLPQEIWSLIQLRHLQYMGNDLPNPCGTALLENLSTLLDVSPCSCTREVFEKIPNLRKLGILIELTQNDASTILSPFDHLLCLERLESLKCVVVNPDFGKSRVVSMPSGVSSVFPRNLTKLTLSGCGFPWEETSKISRLPCLQVLKLQCNAFRGPDWVVKKDEFGALKFLLLEDMDLVHWRTNDMYIFRKLQRLCVRHCYKLEEMPDTKCVPLKMVEIVDCNPSAMNWEGKIKELSNPVLGKKSPVTQLLIHFSWNDKKRPTQSIN